MTNVATHLQRAVGCYQRGDFQGALSASEDVLSLSPDHAEGWHMKALSLGKLRRVDDAVAAFERAAAGHPQKYAVLSNLGNVLRAAGRMDDAAAAYKKATQANPAFVQAWTGLGLSLRDVGDLEGAERAYRRALALEPQNPGVLNNLGVLLNDDATRDEAVSLFDKALQVSPNMVSALVNRGAALRAAGAIDAALADHRRAVSLAPQSCDVRHQLANTLRQAGAFDEAESQYAAALQIAPQRADIHRDHEKMLWEIGADDRFLRVMQDVLRTRPEVELLLAHSELSLLADQVGAAQASAERILSTDPDNAVALSILGRIHSAQGRHEESLEAFRHAHQAAPGDFETRQHYGEALLRAGQYETAVELLSVAAPVEHRQRQVALYVLALRAAGRDEYKRYYDYDRFTAQIEIETPPGYDDLAAFNAALIEALKPLHTTSAQPIDQTLYGGTQSFGRLWNEKAPEIQALKTALLGAAAKYAASLPDDPSHPFLAAKATEFQCTGAWSVILRSGGGHVDHIHPAGWISAAYYVRVPDEIGQPEGDGRAGQLRLGASGVRGLELGPERWFAPRSGTVIFFPSYMWHGVEPFESDTPRITAPFDLKPAVTFR